MNVVTYRILLGIAALIAGLFNLPAAYEKLRETCKGLLFFEPLKSLGFWILMIIQVLFPAGIFLAWVTDFFTSEPPIDFPLFVKAIGVGLSFVAFLNARTETVFLTIDIKSVYNRLIVIGVRLIAAQETRRTAQFLREFERELMQPTAMLEEGLKDLRAYFSADISLSPEEEETFLRAIDQALRETSLYDKITATQSLVQSVRRQDLFYTLQQFNVRPEFLQYYFPKEFKALKGNPIR
ncbi:hypothetical protein ACQ4M4_13845 [Leptolyngbya sp. AN02str]|uniref:hypothetical protein n=1 Tax=Leptolyngbya sp. AN02str TaxID=3423363 RepID=UPI003D319FF9